MNQQKPLKFVIAILALAALACGLNPLDLIQNQAEEALGDVQATIESQTGLDVEEIQATAEAALGDLDVEELQATAEAALGDLSVEEIQATAEAVLEEAGAEGLQETAMALGETVGIGENVDSEFPIPEGSTNIVTVGGILNFTSNMNLDEIIQFYRDEFANAGYTERDLLTVIEDNTASIVWDGDESGQAIVVQLVDLGVGGVNVNVRKEDL